MPTGNNGQDQFDQNDERDREVTRAASGREQADAASRLVELVTAHTLFLQKINTNITGLQAKVESLEKLQPGYIEMLGLLSEHIDAASMKERTAPAEFLFSQERSMQFAYTPGSNTLASLCDLYGSDKGSLKESGHPYPWPAHTYTDLYSLLFSFGRNHVKNVFECGLGTNNPTLKSSMGSGGRPGASLRVWRDFFPNATVYGADIDRDILFEEERIKTYYIDQTSLQAIKEFWANIDADITFDIIIDDGLHTFPAGVCLLSNSIHRLSDDGLYIIEDVNYQDIFSYQKYFSNKKYSVEYVMLGSKARDSKDNNMIIIRK